MDNHHPTMHADRLLQAHSAERTLRDVSRSFLGVYGDGGALRLPKVASNLPKPPKARRAEAAKARTRTSASYRPEPPGVRLPGMRFPHGCAVPPARMGAYPQGERRAQAYDERTDETRPPAHAHATPRMPIRLDTDEETLAN